MIYKSRRKSRELFILEMLHKRMPLPDQEKNYYLSLKKGFEGELMFDALTEKLESDFLVLNDLLLKNNKTTFQIDSLIISSNKLYFYEIKNLEGDHFYETDKLFKLPKTEVPNPLFQLRRSETLLKQLIFSLGFNLPVEGFVVFINPEFTLYQSPLNYPFLFPTQIKRYLRVLDSGSTSVITEKHKKLADKLVELHHQTIKENNYSNVPEYKYEDLRKGITCAKCESFSVTIQGRSCMCINCGNVESVTTAIIRATNEFKALFPKEPITTNTIHHWCKIIDSKKRVQRVLDSNYSIISKRKWTYYE
ncbi:nuclease-related domain-containing protein [Ureibacillus acetophenoni]|uniref:Nuclease-like protein n=1 Tax=Ureibacillus acetophenoni TaxID=614649 RepID=A0A285UK61_9BACL|nr:nuclease-related domain-containing protein [Ureibacillus acetophenoni]SOC42285.1 nuclease-like protein [Ureibacillus acetophenoni]